MEKKIVILFLFSILFGYSQNNPLPTRNSSKSNKTSEAKNIRKNITIGISYGISTPSSSFKKDGFASNGSFIEFDGTYYFSNFGIGLSVGQYKNPTENNLTDFTNSINFTTVNNSSDWKVAYYGVGPEYTATFNKIEISFLLRTGIMSIKPVTLESSFNQNIDISFPVYSFTTEKTTNLFYLSTGIKIGYNLTKNLNLFASTDYLSALSKLTITEKNIQDTNKNGIIDAEDLEATNNGTSIVYTVTTKNSKPQTTNFGIGLSYSFGSKTGNNAKSPGDPLPGMDITTEQASEKTTTTDNTDALLRGIEKSEIKRGMLIKSKGNNAKSPGDPIPRMDITTEQASEKTTTTDNTDALLRGIEKSDIKRGVIKEEDKLDEDSDGDGLLNGTGNNAKSPGDPLPGMDITTEQGSKKINTTDNTDTMLRGIEKSEIRRGVKKEGDKHDEDSDGDGFLEISTRVVNDCTDNDTSPPKKMNKGELVDAIAKDANLSKVDTEKALETITSHLSKSLKKGNTTQLIGYKHSISVRTSVNSKKINNSQDTKGNSGTTQMNKAELVDALAKDANLSKADGRKVLNAFVSMMSKELNSSPCLKLIVPVTLNKKLEQGMIKSIFPPTNSSFESIDGIENFIWEIIGKKLPNPQYTIKIEKIGKNNKTEKTYVGTTTNPEIAAKRCCKALADELVNLTKNDKGTNEEQFGNGRYKWKVTETTTKFSSNYSFFTIEKEGKRERSRSNRRLRIKRRIRK